MPQIIVTSGASRDVKDATVMLRERVNTTDFESERFVANLLERLGWAVEDATVAERPEPAAKADSAAPAGETVEPEPEAGYAWDPEPVQVS